MISTRDLSHLPDIDTLKRLMQSLAMLDAIISPVWEHRYFSFNAHWSADEQLGSMLNGSGNHYFALFNATGCWLKGFDHESPMSPFASNPPRIAIGVLKGVPGEFASCLNEPAFMMEETTFCIWRRHTDNQWHHGPVKHPANHKDPDGSAHLLQHLDGRWQTYHAWAEEYYDRQVAPAAVQSIYAHQPLDQRVVGELNKDISLADLRADAGEIGYAVR